VASGVAGVPEAGGRARARRALPGVLALVFVLALWFAVKAVAQPSDLILPSPVAVAETAVERFDVLLDATWFTVVGAFGGFLAGNVVGVLGAMAVAASPTAARVVLPMALVVRVIPVIALAPFLTLALGGGLATIFTIAGLIVFFPTLINGVLGFRSVDAQTLELMRILDASAWDVFRRVRVPTALPYLFSAFQVGAASCILGAMIAEWVTSGEGLGFLILQSGVQFEVELMWAGVVIASLLALSAFGLMGWLGRRYAGYLAREAM
jgi:NitT/TauT family transport system permease protein